MSGREELHNGGYGGIEPAFPRRRFAAAAVAATTPPFVVATGSAQEAVFGTPPQRLAAAPETAGTLDRYVSAPDPATRTEFVAEGEHAGGIWKTLRVVSQRWRGVEWTHELSVYAPKHVPTTVPDRGGTMLFWIDGGSASRESSGSGATDPLESVRWIAAAANAAGMPAAVIRQVPYQPMFGGLKEDGLIAHSFAQFVETGDPTWPLLLPMVKAAVAGMNAAAVVARESWRIDVSGFVVLGASKRGWTTWLTAAVDRRVVGVVPLVIDMLAIDRHVRLQRESFGRLSEKLEDYTSRGIEQLLATPRGRELVGIVDPYAYRDRLGMPKLITLGTNDPYWPLEALELYRRDLPGPCWVSYCPNAGHGIPGPRLLGLVAALGRHAAGLETLPEVSWSFERDGGGTRCRCTAAGDPMRLTLWQARSRTRDFRGAQWVSEDVPGAGPTWEIRLSGAEDMWSAAFVEVHHARRPQPVVLTTGVHVSPAVSG